MRILWLFFFVTIFSNYSAQSILFNSSGGTPDPSAIMEMRSTDQGVLVPRMLAAQRLAISSPAQGLLVFQSNGTVGFYYYNGSAWDTLGGATTVTNISNVTDTSNTGIAVILDKKGSGVAGGTFTKNAWQIRDLNLLEGDVSFITLAGNEFTLDSGTYIISASAPAYGVDLHQIRLYNTTTSSIVKEGTAANSSSSTAKSALTTGVTIASGTNSFKIEHRCSFTNTTDGMGLPVSWGNNIYTQITVQKL